MTWFLFYTVLSSLLIPSVLFSGNLSVSDKIDQGITFAESGRSDIAENMLEKLLDQPLSEDEATTVYYNLATIYARGGQYQKALGFFERISMSQLTAISKKSPLTALSILYNQAVCLVKAAEQKHSDPAALRMINEAKSIADETKKLLSSTVSESITIGMLTLLYEEIASTKQKVRNAFFAEDVSVKSKPLFYEFALHEFHALFTSLATFQNSNGKTISLYVKDLGMQYGFKMKVLLKQTVEFLQQINQKSDGVQVQFLQKQFHTLENQFFDAMRDGDLEKALQSTYAMIVLLNVCDAKDETDAIQRLLLMRQTVQLEFVQYKDPVDQLVKEYIKDAIEAREGVQQALLKRLLEEISRVPLSVQSALYDSAFFPLLMQPLDSSFTELLNEKEPAAIVFQATIARLEAEGKEGAVSLLQQAQSSTNNKLLIFKSWFAANPAQALSTWSGALAQEIKMGSTQLQFDEFLDFFRAYVKIDPKFADMYEHLKNEDDRFDKYITLFTFHAMLQDDLAAKIQSAISMQQDILKAFSYAPKSVFWSWNIQKSLVEQFKGLVVKLKTPESTAKKLNTLFGKILLLLSAEPTTASSEKVAQLLTEALKLLQQPEIKQEREEQRTPVELTEEMRKKSLNLSPDTSIRLLQMMEQDDADLFTTPQKEKIGARPW